MSNSKEMPHFKAAIKIMLEQQDSLIVTLIKGINAAQTAPNNQERAEKIDKLKADIFADSSFVTGFESEKLAAYFNKLEILSSNPTPMAQEKETLKKKLREERRKNASIFTTDKHIELGKRSPSQASDECPIKKMQDESSDDDDSEEDDDGETCAMSQKPSMFDFLNLTTIVPPVNHAVLTAMAEKDVLRDLHDKLIELKQYFYESESVVEELTEEFEKRYQFLEKIAETLDRYSDPSINEEIQTDRDNELLIIILAEHERLNAELADEFKFST